MKIYYYKLTVDDGGAPCVQNEVLSLAICKPTMRSTAEAGDLIYGFAANEMYADNNKKISTDNHLIYVAIVTKNLRNGGYYRNSQYVSRGDCVYERRGDRFTWRAKALYHGPKDVDHDLGKYPDYARANTLLSKENYRYYGADGSADYKTTYPLIADAICRLGQGHRVYHDDLLREQFLNLKRQLWRTTMTTGKQTSCPKRGVCHRSKSCGVLH